jgi:hypothetical protein
MFWGFLPLIKEVGNCQIGNYQVGILVFRTNRAVEIPMELEFSPCAIRLAEVGQTNAEGFSIIRKPKKYSITLCTV